MGAAELGHPPEPESSARPGTHCFCGLPARRRISYKKPGWAVAEERDVCEDHAREWEAQQAPPPSAEEGGHVRD